MDLSGANALVEVLLIHFNTPISGECCIVLLIRSMYVTHYCMMSASIKNIARGCILFTLSVEIVGAKADHFIYE